MSLKKYKIDLSYVKTLEELLGILNILNFSYTVDTSKPDATFEKLKKMGVIQGEVLGDIVKCDMCSHKFRSPFVDQMVKCPNCKNNTYVEPYKQ